MAGGSEGLGRPPLENCNKSTRRESRCERSRVTTWRATHIFKQTKTRRGRKRGIGIKLKKRKPLRSLTTTKRESLIFVIVFIFCIIDFVPSILLLLSKIYVWLFVHLPASFMDDCHPRNHILFHSSTSCFCELNNSYWPRLSLVRFTNGRHPVAHLAHLLAWDCQPMF